MNVKETIDIVHEKIYNPTNADKSLSSYKYALTSAALKRFFPDISTEEHELMYKDILFNQAKAGIEQFDTDIVDELEIINHSDFSLSNQNAQIFATFHLGSYRAINRYLVDMGFKVVLIIDDEVFQNQKDDMLKAYNELKAISANKNSDFVILNVKDRTSIYALKKLIAEGYSLVVYLDGNTGLKKEIDFKKGHKAIIFLGQKIFVKTGVEFISKITDTKIIPVISYRNKTKSNLAFYEPICNKSGAIEICYKHLENLVRIYPTQWECWLYIHKWFERNNFDLKNTETEPISGSLAFNSKVFIPFCRGGSHFLLNRDTYLSYPISKEHFQMFSKQKVVSENVEEYKSIGAIC